MIHGIAGRLALIAGLIVALGGARATPALGQAASSQRLPVTVFTRTCAGETLLVSGEVHVVFRSAVDESGGSHLLIHTNYAGLEGVDAAGNTYRASGVSHSTVNFVEPGSVVTLVDRFNLIGQWQAPDMRMFALLHVTVNAQGETTAFVENVHTNCDETG